ncbi:hypothetical protein PG1C_08395 [Rugosibacter aromaticivorans]|uniref:TMEM205-like domain-containing protein n=1 Tax=Rugosibacter aromaticivorans TaxID=1565605 RepID=A0A0C5J9T9_9PROT|nr:DUF4149 domain-containing protein [Rugosibacter aromaticivorans]AJP48469.1 hypothetical protein PG1C_08395 [Rugosibacter aromaticivorans]TBR15340.1 MAG: DUF4149 domain-containing protein [Rugosibacter sp.]
MRIATAIYTIVIAIWLGSQMAVGYIAAPVLFSRLTDRTLAGELAGAMFSVMAWLSLAFGAYLLLYLMTTQGARAFRSSVFWLVTVMLGITIISHFGIQPVMAQLKHDAHPLPVMESAFHDRFAMWHGVSSGLYLLQTIFGLVLVIVQNRGRRL